VTLGVHEVRVGDIAPAAYPYRSEVGERAERVLQRVGDVPEEADGHVVEAPGTIGLVFGADCLPIAVAGPGGAAILHGGRRGLEQEIAALGVATVEATAAAVGPGIGPCCYEVDLWQEARRQLREAGVQRVESADLCTCCEAELFFSHRRDGDPRRQAGLVWLDEGQR